MATKLVSSPVTRELEYEIDGRKVVVSLESVELASSSVDDFLILRLSGYRTGWEISLRELARYAALHPRNKKTNFRLRVKAEVEDVKAWAKEYEARS